MNFSNIAPRSIVGINNQSPRFAMSPKQLIIAAATLLCVLLLWRLVSVESDVSDLRAMLAKTQTAPVSRAAEHESPSSSRGPEPVAAPEAGALERTREELQQAKDRIAELEGTVSELSDAWNKFAEGEEQKRVKASMRAWGPEQAVGAPDTTGAGDRQTAWAALASDGGIEWLQTEYARPVEVAQVRVLENDTPGGVVKITAFNASGGETVLWQGAEPQLAAPADQLFTVPPGTTANSIRVYIDTGKMPGWEEIDAVELIGRDGSRQWARAASASSTYASPKRGLTLFGSDMMRTYR